MENHQPKIKLHLGVNGEFYILISTENSDVDMSYFVNFENITDDKPQNMIFKIKGNEKEYKSLQELEKTLTGIANNLRNFVLQESSKHNLFKAPSYKAFLVS